MRTILILTLINLVFTPTIPPIGDMVTRTAIETVYVSQPIIRTVSDTLYINNKIDPDATRKMFKHLETSHRLTVGLFSVSIFTLVLFKIIDAISLKNTRDDMERRIDDMYDTIY